MEEEVGISRKDITIIGPLSDLYIGVSNFLVHPFVAYANEPLNYKLQATEVASVLEIPLSHLMDPENLKRKDITVDTDRILKDVPYYDLKGHTLWGATSMMTAELLGIL